MVLVRDPLDCPYYLVSRSALAVTAEMKEEFAAAGLEGVRPAYLGVLMSLWNEDGLNVAELGRRAGVEPSTMTGLLDRMERDRLVARRADPEDRRAQRISLTEEGKKVRDPALDVVDKTLNRVLAGVTDQDLVRVKEVLRRVLANTERVV
jgi:MarR family transcriptional regulator, organic hydroperoxide resistance regulator